DGIRDLIVTGVQTCALPIYRVGRQVHQPFRRGPKQRYERCDGGLVSRKRLARLLDIRGIALVRENVWRDVPELSANPLGYCVRRSEERRVGKECRTGGGTDE